MQIAGVLLATTFLVLTGDENGGPNTLRWAIEQVNATPATLSTRATIQVATTMTVSPKQPLPAITQPAYLDLAKLTLDGAQAGASDGLTIEGDDVYVTGVKITNFSGSGLVLRGNRDAVWHSDISANRIGAVIAGELDGIYDVAVHENRGDGVLVTASAAGSGLGLADIVCPECPFIPMKDIFSRNAGNGVTDGGRATRTEAATIEHNRGDGIKVAGSDATIVNAAVNFNGRNGITAMAPIAQLNGTVGACNGQLFLDERGDGPTANDEPDIDSVVNRPRLDSAIEDLTAVTVAGSFDGAPDTAYQLDFVALPPACDDGARAIGSMWVTTDAHGFAAFRRAFGKFGAIYERTVQSVAATSTRIDIRRPQPFATSELTIPIATMANRDHRADLAISVPSAKTTATWGERVEFETRVTNRGPAAVGFEVSVPRVAGALYDIGWTTSGDCWLGGLAFCGIGPLAPCESAVVHNTVTMPKRSGTFTYRAEALMWNGARDVDPDASNNAATWQVGVQAAAHTRAAKH